ncbi:MAG TPA: ABC transporter permease [Anaerolineaceae bacterium]|nr:ABC transporter permease [Anaerolineaceae bacterium]
MFILKDLVKDGWRTTITIANLTVFLVCYFCLAALAKAAAEYGEQAPDRSALMVISNNVFDPSDSVVTEEQFKPLLELMPEKIRDVSPLIFNLLKVDTYLVQVRAAPLEDFQPVYFLELQDGKWPSAGNEVVIGTGTQALTNWKIGRQIRIFGRHFTITGVIRSPGTKSSSVWMSLDAAEELFGTSGVYQFAWATINPGVDAEEVQSVLQQDPRLKDDFSVYFVDHMYEVYAQAMMDVADVSTVLVFLSLLLVMFGTYGSVFLTLAERSRELTILRAVGYSSKAIRGILTMRTLMQILIAFFLGWLLSAVLLNFISSRIPLVAHAILLDVTISPLIIFAGLVLALLFGWIGVLMPMLRVTNSNVHSIMTGA